MVFETEGVTKSFGGQAVVRDLSIRVTRGDRIGLIGPNGSGKTTLLRLLIGELPPDEGEVRRGAGVQIVHYDQQREQLDPDRSVFDTIADGSDTVVVNGQPQHVHGYLKQFLFPPERALSPVRALSGGERNRLLLARLFTRPSNVLVLDEPTNDLDIETLELLEEMLLDWPGTLLLVSHDRAFIDNVVTSTLVFEGAGGRGQVAGEVKEYVGGYEDWLRQRPQPSMSFAEPANPRTTEPSNRRPSEPTAKKLTFREREELETLPVRIEALEREQRELAVRIASPEFYKERAEDITQALARLEAIHDELLQSLARWDELESRPR
jgi:ATP-binding cassette subfamily F protein uup